MQPFPAQGLLHGVHWLDIVYSNSRLEPGESGSISPRYQLCVALTNGHGWRPAPGISLAWGAFFLVNTREILMASGYGPIRRGVAVTLTLDEDALSLLKTIAPSKTRLGGMVSELIRQEAERRIVRAKTIQELLAGADGIASRD
jgi:hypothetical protein